MTSDLLAPKTQFDSQKMKILQSILVPRHYTAFQFSGIFFLRICLQFGVFFLTDLQRTSMKFHLIQIVIQVSLQFLSLINMMLFQSSQIQPVGGGSSAIGIEDFVLLRVIGRGSYAKVFAVEQKRTKRKYAMKVIKKELVADDDVRPHALCFKLQLKWNYDWTQIVTQMIWECIQNK